MTGLVVGDAAATVIFPGDGPVRGAAFDEIHVAAGMSVACDGERIEALDAGSSGAVEVDASGCTVVPGFVDCHTHLPFFGWRADEHAARLEGRRYEDLHRGEGGIYRSARLLNEASDADVLRFSLALASQMLARGTTTFETKSGYGLSVEAEVRQLRLAAAVRDAVPQTTTATCLAAHAIPPDLSAGGWIGRAADELLPRIADEGLADSVDIYVESIAFALEHAARLAEVAAPLGMRMRIHADQLEDGQAGSFAARWGFATADHLNHTSAAGADDIARSDTVAVLLPGATFTLGQGKKPPARTLVDAGAIVALATDLNPGTSPVTSMSFVLTLACRTYGLRPMEALAAATVNAAHALGLGDRVGRIAPGYRADLVVLDVPGVEHLAYRPDHDPVALVICGGEVVYAAPGAERRVVVR